jgi:NACHT domain
MPTTTTDRHTPDSGSARLGGLLVLAGLPPAVPAKIVGGWPRPSPWLLAQQRTPGFPHWNGVHWAAAIGTAAAVAAVLTPFLLRWLDRRRAKQAAAQPPDAQQRAVLLRRVRHKWIGGVLEPSLANAARLALGLQPRPEVLALGGRAYRHSGRPPQPIPADTPISEVFDKVGGGLLILGAPGAGKTTLLLQLARELLDRAEHDPDQPIPVVLNLASWAREHKPLAEWLADELAVGYTVPRHLARAWLAQDVLTLLLDGLDEVADPHRAACVAALNIWRGTHGLVPLVVCSRTAEFQALASGLRVEESVELQPPTAEQIDTYLGYLEATGTTLADVRAALVGDPALQELLSSPLMLHVVALTYRGRPALALEEPGSVRARQAWLWDAYVARMFEQRPLEPRCGYTIEQARGWLVWLARALRGRDQTEFHLDRLTLEWLATRAQRLAVRLATSLLSGLFAGLFFGLAVGLGRGLAAGLVGALAVGLIGALIGALAGGLSGVIQPTERLYWSWQRLRWNRRPALVFGLFAGLVFGLFVGLVGAPIRGLGAGLIGALIIGLTSGLSDELRDERTVPNEGIRRSAKNALAAGLISGLVLGLFTGLVNGLLGARLSAGLAAGVDGLLYGMVVAGLVYGGAACLQHYVIRAALVHEKAEPWQYGEFLEAMTQRLLLRRSGSAYLFAHRLLRDHLAEAPQLEGGWTHLQSGR